MKTTKRSVTFLLIGVIAIMAFIKNPVQHWIMIGFFSLWSIFHIIRFIIWCKRKPKTVKSKTDKVKHAKKEKKPANQKITSLFKSDSVETNGTDSLVTALIRHVNCRISDKLKSAYPDATWIWCETNIVKLMTEGGTGRIKTTNMKEFNQADVTVDKYGSISFTMLKAEPLSNPANPGESKTEPVVDVSMWYNLIGQKVISAIVVELNTHGHQTMYIKENGDIVTGSGDTETKHETLENFPKISAWTELVNVFTGDGLSANVDDKKIKLSW